MTFSFTPNSCFLFLSDPRAALFVFLRILVNEWPEKKIFPARGLHARKKGSLASRFAEVVLFALYDNLRSFVARSARYGGPPGNTPPLLVIPLSKEAYVFFLSVRRPGPPRFLPLGSSLFSKFFERDLPRFFRGS